MHGCITPPARWLHLYHDACDLLASALSSFQTELRALEAENATLAAIEARTHLLTGGHKHGQDPLASRIMGSEPFDSDDDDDGDDGDSTSDDGGKYRRRPGDPAVGDSPEPRAVGAAAAQFTLSTIAPGTLTAGRGGLTGSASAVTLPPASAGVGGASRTNPSRLASQASVGALTRAGPRVAGVGTSGSLALTSYEVTEVERISQLRKLIRRVRRSVASRDFQRRQYEHMVSRLRANAAVFERHMKGLDDAIRASRKELGDVTGYLRMLESSKEATMLELHRLQVQLQAEKAARTKELDERRAELSRATKMEDWRKQREAVRAEMQAELAGDLSKEQEELLLSTLAQKEAAAAKLLAERRVREDRAAALQDAFTRIKQITGVTSLDEMVEKFLGQAANRAALEKERREAEVRLANAKEALETARRELMDLKASGSAAAAAHAASAAAPDDAGDGEGPDADDAYEEQAAALTKQISGAKAELKMHRSACKRLEDILVSVRQGAVALGQVLEPFQELVGGDAQPAGASAVGASAPAPASARGAASSSGSGGDEGDTVPAHRHGHSHVHHGNTHGHAGGGGPGAAHGHSQADLEGLPWLAATSAAGKQGATANAVDNADALQVLARCERQLDTMVEIMLQAVREYLRSRVAAGGESPRHANDNAALLEQLESAARGKTPSATAALLTNISAATVKMLAQHAASPTGARAPSVEGGGSEEDPLAAVAAVGGLPVSPLPSAVAARWPPSTTGEPVMHSNNVRVPAKRGVEVASSAAASRVPDFASDVSGAAGSYGIERDNWLAEQGDELPVSELRSGGVGGGASTVSSMRGGGPGAGVQHALSSARTGGAGSLRPGRGDTTDRDRASDGDLSARGANAAAAASAARVPQLALGMAQGATAASLANQLATMTGAAPGGVGAGIAGGGVGGGRHDDDVLDRRAVKRMAAELTSGERRKEAGVASPTSRVGAAESGFARSGERDGSAAFGGAPRATARSHAAGSTGGHGGSATPARPRVAAASVPEPTGLAFLTTKPKLI